MKLITPKSYSLKGNMAKGDKKKGLKAKRRQEEVEPLAPATSAAEVEVSDFSNIEGEVDGNTVKTVTPVRLSKRLSKKT